MTSRRNFLPLLASTLILIGAGHWSCKPVHAGEMHTDEATDAKSDATASKTVETKTDAGPKSVVIAKEELPIDRLNAEFRRCYSDAKADVLMHLGPSLVVASKKVSLYNNGKLVQSLEYVPESYNALKTIDHLPLAIFVELLGQTDKELGADKLDVLKKLQETSEPAAKAVLPMGLGADAIERQKKMVASSNEFINKVLETKKVSRAELDAFAKANLADTLENVYDSVALEMSELNRVVQRYRTQLGPAEWKKVHVVITGSHMARDKERAFQYFSKLLNENEEGDHIVYLEGSDEEEKALDLLATHQVDAQIALSYFGDKWRMHRDLLSDAAKKYLDAHPPQ